MDFIRLHRDEFGVEPICAALTEHGIKIAPRCARLRSTGRGSRSPHMNSATTPALGRRTVLRPGSTLTLQEIADLLGHNLKTVKTWNDKGAGLLAQRRPR